MAFSPEWEPDQLAEWLLQVYGKAYQDDIGKLQKEKVNAELFLDLPDDEEFLNELGLSRGFKRLVVKKANELKRKAVVLDGDADGRSLNAEGSSRAGMEKSEQQAQSSQGRGQLIADPVTGLAGNQHHSLPDRRIECGGTTTSAAVDQRLMTEILASIPQANRWKLDQEIDFEHKSVTGQTIPKHLGKIADSMTNWEGAVADYLGLSDPDRSDIRERNGSKPAQQRRDALMKWKSGLGSRATYRALIEVFFQAGELTYAEFVCNLLKDTEQMGLAGAPVARAAAHGMTTRSQATTGGGQPEFDKFEVQNHHLNLLEWSAVVGAQPNRVRVYDTAAVMWVQVAECLGLTPGDITSISRNKFDDRERVTAVLQRWFDNANNLPNNRLYPKKWSGLIRLLSDSDLGELAESVREALVSPCSSVKGNT